MQGALIDRSRVDLSPGQHVPLFQDFLPPEKVIWEEAQNAMSSTSEIVDGDLNSETDKLLIMANAHRDVLHVKDHQRRSRHRANRIVNLLRHNLRLWDRLLGDKVLIGKVNSARLWRSLIVLNDLWLLVVTTAPLFLIIPPSFRSTAIVLRYDGWLSSLRLIFLGHLDASRACHRALLLMVTFAGASGAIPT